MPIKLIILFFSLTIPVLCFSQKQTVHPLQKSYNSAYLLLSADTKKIMTLFKSTKTDFALIASTTHNTLNKADLIKPTNIEVTDTSSTPTTYSDDETEQNFFFSSAAFNKDTLYIYLHNGPMSSQSILHRIVKEKVITTYYEWTKYDAVFKTQPWKPATTNILLNCTTDAWRVSTTKYKVGTIFYAFIDFKTPSHFYLMDYHFTDHTIYRKLGWQYYLKITIIPFNQLKELIKDHYAQPKP